MFIRQATITDLELLVPLFDRYRQFYKQPTDFKGALKFLKQRFTNNESIVYLAFPTSDFKTPIGFTQLYPLFSSVSMKSIIVLNDLYIQEDYRGQGIGKALIDKVKQVCIEQNSKGIALQTEISNPAQKLYEREGFTIDKDLQYFWDCNK